MKGLIIKEFLNLRKTLLYILGFIALYGVIFASSDGLNMGMMMAVIMAGMLTITSFSYDDLAKWPKYALSLPITRKDLVKSKYLFAGLMILLGVVAALLVGIATEIFLRDTPDFSSMWGTLYGSVIGAAVYVGVLLPLVFQFGAEKSRYLILAGVFVPVAVFTLASRLLGGFSLSLPSRETIKLLLYLSPALLVLFVGISYWLSIRIFSKKEL
ncbi:ABC-2 transporter permease [Eubacteriales bacterium OttesenSCG-928-M02]|nr:ABC-2 transporter permease [Eubacteriales bacterium OttesenSCG-928-M02]